MPVLDVAATKFLINLLAANADIPLPHEPDDGWTFIDDPKGSLNNALKQVASKVHEALAGSTASVKQILFLTESFGYKRTNLESQVDAMMKYKKIDRDQFLLLKLHYTHFLNDLRNDSDEILAETEAAITRLSHATFIIKEVLTAFANKTVAQKWDADMEAAADLAKAMKGSVKKAEGLFNSTEQAVKIATEKNPVAWKNIKYALTYVINSVQPLTVVKYLEYGSDSVPNSVAAKSIAALIEMGSLHKRFLEPLSNVFLMLLENSDGNSAEEVLRRFTELKPLLQKTNLTGCHEKIKLLYDEFKDLSDTGHGLITSISEVTGDEAIKPMLVRNALDTANSSYLNRFSLISNLNLQLIVESERNKVKGRLAYDFLHSASLFARSRLLARDYMMIDLHKPEKHVLELLTVVMVRLNEAIKHWYKLQMAFILGCHKFSSKGNYSIAIDDIHFYIGEVNSPVGGDGTYATVVDGLAWFEALREDMNIYKKNIEPLYKNDLQLLLEPDEDRTLESGLDLFIRAQETLFDQFTYGTLQTCGQRIDELRKYHELQIDQCYPGNEKFSRQVIDAWRAVYEESPPMYDPINELKLFDGFK